MDRHPPHITMASETTEGQGTAGRSWLRWLAWMCKYARVMRNRILAKAPLISAASARELHVAVGAIRDGVMRQQQH